jgi:hypothetical protein
LFSARESSSVVHLDDNVSSVEVVISIVSIENRICKQTRLALVHSDTLFASSGSERGYSVTYPIIVTLGPVTVLSRYRDGIYCDFRE